MAVYSNLPVFKASYDLVVDVFKIGDSMPRDYKYTIGEKLKDRLIELMVGIYTANVEADRTGVLKQCRRHVVEIKLYLRLLHDLKQLSVKRYAGLSEQIEIISKQLTAWQKYGEYKNRNMPGVS